MQTDPLSAKFAALADPTRRAILARLCEGEASVNELAEPFDMALPSFLKHIRATSNEQRRLYDEMLGKLAEKIAGIQVVKAFVRERHEQQSFMESVRKKFSVDMSQVHLNRRLGMASTVISALGTGIVYAYGGSLVQVGQMTRGDLVAMTFYIGFIFNPAVRVIDFNTSLQWAVSAMERVFETLDTRPDIEDKPDAPPLPLVRGQVTFDSVRFGYVDGQWVLDDIRLEVLSRFSIRLPLR